MKLILLLFCSMFIIRGTCQHGSGGGIFPEYAEHGIRTLTKLHISYNDSLINDTTHITKQYFDKKGQMVREEFNGIYDSRCRYEYDYNDEGLPIEIEYFGQNEELNNKILILYDY